MLGSTTRSSSSFLDAINLTTARDGLFVAENANEPDRPYSLLGITVSVGNVRYLLQLPALIRSRK